MLDPVDVALIHLAKAVETKLSFPASRGEVLLIGEKATVLSSLI
jgi:hypothetical protein